MKAFTDSWVDTFSTVYSDEPLARLAWFTASPGIELIKLVADGVIKRGDRVVDLGCGPGVDSVFLAAQGMHVTGIDLSDAALEKARAWARLSGVSPEFVQGDVLDPPLSDGVADVVTDSFVFHNMRDDARSIYADQVHRLLRPDGLFVLNSFSDRMVPGTGPRRITSSDILSTFDSTRFDCEELRTYRNLPTATKPDQIHWIGRFRKVG
ncbi:class I SAM-dependent methyltransferase [Streptomyces canus]|uniref:class I SAM-dependent methyltransferase n=1 Tax=Streptomyces canus TaxID=58343 RepID=UPI000371E814|nr:class I SAM-dependent methyltransferase [Streptomyces canus]